MSWLFSNQTILYCLFGGIGLVVAGEIIRSLGESRQKETIEHAGLIFCTIGSFVFWLFPVLGIVRAVVRGEYIEGIVVTCAIVVFMYILQKIIKIDNDSNQDGQENQTVQSEEMNHE